MNFASIRNALASAEDWRLEPTADERPPIMQKVLTDLWRAIKREMQLGARDEMWMEHAGIQGLPPEEDSQELLSLDTLNGLTGHLVPEPRSRDFREPLPLTRAGALSRRDCDEFRMTKEARNPNDRTLVRTGVRRKLVP